MPKALVPEPIDKTADQPSDGPVLRVRGLAKSYGATRVVNDVSFDINAGEVLTLLGPSGCGKSTTLRLIAGLEQPDAGEVWSVAGWLPPPTQHYGPARRAQSRACVPILRHLAAHDGRGKHRLSAEGASRRSRRSRARSPNILLVKLDGLGARMPTELSGGQQQRVALARALVYEPDLLLLDEPLSNLDSVLRKEMRSQIKLLQSRLATTVLYVTHDQEEAMALSNHVVVMNQGRIEQIGPPGIVYEQPSTRFVQDFVGETIRLRGEIEGDGSPLRFG